MRHTHREIAEAKMLGRRLAALRNAPVPPLSRLRSATTLLTRAVILALRMKVRAAWRRLRNMQVCPRCEGRHDMIEFNEMFGPDAGHDDNLPGTKCRLCRGTGEVDQRRVESFKWGRAAMRYRLLAGMSLAKAYYLCGLTPDQITMHEEGLVPLDDWPSSLRDIADLQLDREAAGHVSTT